MNTYYISLTNAKCVVSRTEDKGVCKYSIGGEYREKRVQVILDFDEEGKIMGVEILGDLK